MGKQFERDLAQIVAAKRSGKLSEQEFEAVAIYRSLQASGSRSYKPVLKKPKRRRWTVLATILILIWIAGKFGGPDDIASQVRDPVQTTAVAKPQRKVEVKPEALHSGKTVMISLGNVQEPDYVILDLPTKHKVCKAAIAALIGQMPSIIRTFDARYDWIEVDYDRPSDGTNWRYNCVIDRNRVIWAALGGRWRDHELDERYASDRQP